MLSCKIETKRQNENEDFYRFIFLSIKLRKKKLWEIIFFHSTIF